MKTTMDKLSYNGKFLIRVLNTLLWIILYSIGGSIKNPFEMLMMSFMFSWVFEPIFLDLAISVKNMIRQITQNKQ